MPEGLIDDLHLLRAIDAMEAAEWTDGLNVMNAAGLEQYNEPVLKAFVRLVVVLAEDGLLRVDYLPPQQGNVLPPRPDELGYLSGLRNFRLTSAGLDRARGRVVLTAGLDPATDDGRRFPGRVVERAAGDIADRFTPEELQTFLVDAGIPPQRVPKAVEDKAEYITVVLKAQHRATAPAQTHQREACQWRGWSSVKGATAAPLPP
jgi:hypothetical protein